MKHHTRIWIANDIIDQLKTRYLTETDRRYVIQTILRRALEASDPLEATFTITHLPPETPLAEQRTIVTKQVTYAVESDIPIPGRVAVTVPTVPESPVGPLIPGPPAVDEPGPLGPPTGDPCPPDPPADPLTAPAIARRPAPPPADSPPAHRPPPHRGERPPWCCPRCDHLGPVPMACHCRCHPRPMTPS